MSTRPRLSRSIPFWILIVGSLATSAGGAYLLVDKLGGMDARLTDGSATTNDVYVGQIWGVLGAILIGAGLIGFALALTVAALRTLSAPATPAVEVEAASPEVEADAPVEEASLPEGSASPASEDGDAYGYETELGYAPNETPAPEETPVGR